MALFKSLTFGNVNSMDYGVYITGAGVYNAPERAVEMYAIPGRNGALAIDGGRYENIEVTYTCGCFAETDTEFSEKIRAFRNAICSQYSYTRLTDEYNPDEYRMALYHSGLEVEPFRSKAGEFEITFDCKPQRFLTSGESTYQIGEWGQTITQTGDIVTYQGDDLTEVKSLTTDMEPIQDLHGYDSPWVGGAGKNKAELTNPELTTNTTQRVATLGMTGTYTLTLSFDLTNANCETASAALFNLVADSANNYLLPTSLKRVSDNASWSNITKPVTGRFYYTFASKVDPSHLNTYFESASYGKWTGSMSNVQLEISATPTAFAPYSNICPIYGRTGQTVYVSQTTSTSDADVYTSDFVDSQGNTLTVYGGEDEIVGGVLTVDMTYDQMTYSYLSGLTDYIGFATNITAVGGNAVWVRNWNYSQMAGRRAGGIKSACNAFPIDIHDTNLSASQNRVYFGVGSMTSVAEFLSAVQALENGGGGLYIAYELATPITYQLTPQEVTTLIGTNHVWSDAGEVTVEYGTDPYTMVNDTQFASKPLIKVTGYGEVGFGDITITITGTAGVVTYIDCDLMECYRMSGGAIVPANQYVTFTGTDFPIIPTGKTRVTSASTISKVEVVPRWWII